MSLPMESIVDAPVAAPVRGRRVYLETFGCQMNKADSEVILAGLTRAGYRGVNDLRSADVICYNTCSVRDKAEAKIRGRLGMVQHLKQERPDIVCVVLGCMAQRGKAELLKQFPTIDLVVGTDQFVHLPALIDRYHQEGRLVATDFGNFETRPWPARRDPGINAWVPIMRGCNYRCTYCIVPTTRGPEKSRRPEAVEDEIRRLVDDGHVQVTLLGQTVDAYGKDFGDGTSLASLLRRLHAIDGLKRIRFITSHPKDITDDLLRTMADLPKVARHLHVPAQHGSSRILRLMGRRYTRDDYLRFVERARHHMPDVELLTDMIVGFPRETDADFQESVSLMREVVFDGAFVFMYSPRPGTGATRLGDDVDHEVKRARCNDLLALQLSQQDGRHRRLVGQTMPGVLIEGPSKTDDGQLMGRNSGNRIVIVPRIDGDGRSRDDLIGQLVDVRVTSATDLSLFGDPLS